MNKLNTLLLLGILASSVFLIQARYHYRVLTSEISIQKQETDKLKEETERLIYDYNTYAKPARILKWAIDNNMVEPKINTTIFADK